MTNTLLIILILATLARMTQAHIHQKQLITWLDSLADLTGDQLGTIINEMRKK